jgi:adenosine kinase
MSIVVTGSVAFDHIMDFSGQFKDHILPDKIHVLSVSFLVDKLQKLSGGCAANLACNLALPGERPKIFATLLPNSSRVTAQPAAKTSNSLRGSSWRVRRARRRL